MSNKQIKKFDDVLERIIRKIALEEDLSVVVVRDMIKNMFARNMKRMEDEDEAIIIRGFGIFRVSEYKKMREIDRQHSREEMFKDQLADQEEERKRKKDFGDE